MEEWLSRTEQLLGKDTLSALQNSHVLIVGVGGVGAYAAEMICRAGVQEITIIDGDNINPTNINRQLIAMHSTVGKPKTQILAQRLLDINPRLNIHIKQLYMDEAQTEILLDEAKYDYVIDAIDTISPKIALLTGCLKRKGHIFYGCRRSHRSYTHCIRRYFGNIPLRFSQSCKEKVKRCRHKQRYQSRVLFGTTRPQCDHTNR